MWRLRMQLVSFDRSAKLIDLLRFPQPPLAPPQPRMRARWWRRERLIRKSYPDVQKLIEELGHEKANEIELTYSSMPHRLDQSQWFVKSIVSVLKVSPTNDLWSTSSGYTLTNAASEAIRATYESRELFVKWNELDHLPSLLEVEFTIEGGGTFDELSLLFHSLLPATMQGVLPCTPISGVGDVLEDGVFAEDLLGVLAPWPNSCLALEKSFDDLHPILIGDRNLCTRFAESLGEGVELEIVSDKDCAHSLGLVWIPRAVLENPESRERVQPLLIARKAQALTQSQKSEGEFLVAGHRFRTKAAHERLREKNLLPTLGPGFTYFPLVAEKYARHLGLDHDAVLVELWQKSLIQKSRTEIDEAFAALPRELSLKERTWLAHEKVYRKWLYREEKIIAFLRRYFLGKETDWSLNENGDER